MMLTLINRLTPAAVALTGLTALLCAFWTEAGIAMAIATASALYLGMDLEIKAGRPARSVSRRP